MASKRKSYLPYQVFLKQKNTKMPFGVLRDRIVSFLLVDGALAERRVKR